MEKDTNVYDAVLASMPDNIKHQLVCIYNEYLRSCELHDEWPVDQIHQAAIVAEEAGELVQAALQHKYEKGFESHMKEEAVQVGAMSLRFLVNEIKYWCWACNKFIPIDEAEGDGYHDVENGGCGCKMALKNDCNG